MSENTNILQRLMAVIEDRKANPIESSYTCSLLQKGSQQIEQKIREESQELCEASQADQAARGRRAAILHEAADLTYHLLVLLAFHGLSLRDLEDELARRFGVSGLAEKASRRQTDYEGEAGSKSKPPAGPPDS